VYVLKCRKCGYRTRDKSRGKALSRMRNHWSKAHKAELSKRIRAGMIHNPGPLKFLRDVITGDIIPGYSGYKRKHYEAVKAIMPAILPYLPPEVQAGWHLIDKIADRVYPKRK